MKIPRETKTMRKMYKKVIKQKKENGNAVPKEEMQQIAKVAIRDLSEKLAKNILNKIDNTNITNRKRISKTKTRKLFKQGRREINEIIITVQDLLDFWWTSLYDNLNVPLGTYRTHYGLTVSEDWFFEQAFKLMDEKYKKRLDRNNYKNDKPENVIDNIEINNKIQIKKVGGGSKHRVYRDEAGFIRCEYERRGKDYYDYILEISVLNIRKGFNKLKQVKKYLEDNSKEINKKLKKYYKVRKYFLENEPIHKKKLKANRCRYNKTLNELVKSMVNNPSREIFNNILEEKIDINTAKQRMKDFDCKKEIFEICKSKINAIESTMERDNNDENKKLKELKDRIKTMKNNNISLKDKGYNTIWQSREVYEKLNRDEIEQIGKKFLKDINQVNIEEFKKKVDFLKDSVTEEKRNKHKEEWFKGKFNEFKRSKTKWKKKGQNFLNEVMNNWVSYFKLHPILKEKAIEQAENSLKDIQQSMSTINKNKIKKIEKIKKIKKKLF